MRLNPILVWSGTVLLVGLTACSQDTAPTAPTDRPSISANKASTQGSLYLVSFSETAPADLQARLTAAGGKVKKISKEAGIAKVVSDAPNFAAQAAAIPGVEGVGKDRIVQWIGPNQRVFRAKSNNKPSTVKGHSIGDNETFFGSQWDMTAIHAPEAWDAGARGTGVRVAVLDGGLNDTHIDLAGAVDSRCSASMVDGFEFNQDFDPDGFSHATHVAGTIAALDNSIGTIGVAPGTTIIGVKVLQEGNGSFEDVIDGILYAADPSSTPGKEGCARADIINMSLGATFVPEKGDKALLKALDKATTFADKHGVLVIASAGNDALNLDEAKKVVTVPAQSARVLAVSATAPVGFALGATNFTRLASYSNFGKAVIDFAAPGGDFVLPGDDLCAIGPIVAPCFVFDFVLSPATLAPDNTGYFFAAGTSQAAPHVAGVAALILSKHGGSGSMKPAQLKAALEQSADDLGKPGFDAVYGHGFVDALTAILH